MHIDWFVFFAQIVNFLILVYLLKRFLYGRIIAAMDNREALIASRLEDAERLKSEAGQSAEAYEKKYQSLLERSEEMLNQAKEAAKAREVELMDRAREEVDQVRQRWLETIEREKISFLQDLRKRAGSQVYAIARNALTELADAELERRIADVFLDRLRNLDSTQAQAIRETMGKSATDVMIKSAFEIPPDIREQIKGALKPYLTDGSGIAFETSSEVISGVEMRAQGHKVAWSLNDYLETLEENFSQALQLEAMKKH
ncbi:MAG: F0F1 ATP synthase subunit B [Deltaproteobacteria bacterium]|nr:F0F1 ATP synthase subunit B [Deltaproteobacteria bacterium]